MFAKQKESLTQLRAVRWLVITANEAKMADGVTKVAQFQQPLNDNSM